MAKSEVADVAVVGAGMLGTSAAKHLALLGVDVVLVGQSEPVDKVGHRGVFASHYDTARIVRVVDRDPFYAAIAERSIARFVEIEAATGIKFFYPVGHVTVSAMADYMAELLSRSEEHDLAVEVLDDAELRIRYPGLRFASGMRAIVENGTGGYIDPRAFLRAQRAALELAGGSVVDGLVTAVDASGVAAELGLEGGRQIRARSVLFATGAFANELQLIKSRIEITIAEHTVVFGQLNVEDAVSLESMPSLIYKRGDRIGESVYLTPPIRDSQGRAWMKIGQSVGRPMPDPDFQLLPWFRSGGDADVAEWLLKEMGELFPGVAFESFYTDSCVVSQSSSTRPYIDCLPSRSKGEAPLYTLLAGNGQVAKSADELGRIAAVRLVDGAVPSEYRAEDFGVRWGSVDN